MSKTLLEVQGLKSYFFTKRGVAKAVNGVSFKVNEGETFGIVGESGSGKSVTGLSILRLLPQPAGTIVEGNIIMDGVNLLELNEKEMRRYRGKEISMILQDPMTSLNPVYTIGDQISESVRLHQKLDKNQIQDEVISALRLLNIPAPEQRLRDYPFQMSGGMRQRVVGAIAMSCHPRLLIADEPTTALDATIQAQYIALFKEVQRKTGVAIIFITHDFGVVANMCHRVAVMYAGRIVETARTRDLLRSPAHPYTAALIQSVPKLDSKEDRLTSIQGQPPSLLQQMPGCSFFPRCSVAERICSEKEPTEVQIGDQHRVTCWKMR